VAKACDLKRGVIVEINGMPHAVKQVAAKYLPQLHTAAVIEQFIRRLSRFLCGITSLRMSRSKLTRPPVRPPGERLLQHGDGPGEVDQDKINITI
jgi:hypothetical protein